MKTGPGHLSADQVPPGATYTPVTAICRRPIRVLAIDADGRAAGARSSASWSTPWTAPDRRAVLPTWPVPTHAILSSQVHARSTEGAPEDHACRVLPCQSQHQVADLLADWRATWPVREGRRGAHRRRSRGRRDRCIRGMVCVEPADTTGPLSLPPAETADRNRHLGRMQALLPYRE